MEFKKGDTPAPGIKILGVIKGDHTDSFSHYVYRRTDTNEIFTSTRYLKQIYVLGPGGKRIADDDKSTQKQPVQVEEIRIVGDPEAACVYFHQDGWIDPDSGVEKDRRMKPDEFEAFLEDYKAAYEKGEMPQPKATGPSKTKAELDAEAKKKLAEMGADDTGDDTGDDGTNTSTAKPLSEVEDLPSQYVTILNGGGISTVEQAIEAGIAGLTKIKGIGESRAKEILDIIKASVA